MNVDNIAPKLGKSLRIFAACALASLLAFSPIAAWGENESSYEENAGNVFDTGEGASFNSQTASVVRDYYWAGQSLNTSNLQVGGDLIAAGQSMQVSGCDVGGSVRIAGQKMFLGNASVHNNITMAGMDMDIENCEIGGGVYCAGMKIAFSGEASGARFAAKTVYLNGTINGNVDIDAESVEIGPDTVVTGNLRVTAKSEPVIAEDAAIGSYDYIYDDGDMLDADAAAAFGGLVILLAIVSKVIGVIGAVIFALVLVWLFRRAVEQATAMARAHIGRILLTGFIAVMISPFAIVALFVFVVTMPIAAALLFALLMIGFISVPFAGASLAKLVFPNMNRFGAAAIGGLVLGVVSIVPFIGFLVNILAFVYTLGFMIQAAWNASRTTPAVEPLGPAEVLSSVAAEKPSESSQQSESSPSQQQ